jgi:hypothetical protein
MAVRDLDELASRGEALQALLQNGCALPKAVQSGLGQFLKGLQPVLNARSASGFVEQLCRYHERVQSGKLDASRQPKHPWVSLRDNHIEIAPRFALEGHPESHEDRFTHPYRIESFVGMLAELQMLGQAA